MCTTRRNDAVSIVVVVGHSNAFKAHEDCCANVSHTRVVPIHWLLLYCHCLIAFASHRVRVIIPININFQYSSIQQQQIYNNNNTPRIYLCMYIFAICAFAVQQQRHNTQQIINISCRKMLLATAKFKIILPGRLLRPTTRYTIICTRDSARNGINLCAPSSPVPPQMKWNQSLRLKSSQEYAKAASIRNVIILIYFCIWLWCPQ